MNTFRILVALLVALPSFGALPTSTVFEVNQGGDNSNGSCFITGSSGTDKTYPTPAVTSYTDLVAVTATTITSVASPFGATDVGNCIRIASGTGWTPGVYYVVSVAVVTATVDRAIATMGSTGGVGKLGGAMATLAQLNTDMCNSCIGYVKADAPYVIAAKVTFNYSNSAASQVNGYTTTRGDNGKATIQSTGSIGGDRLVDLNVGNQFTFRNFKIDVNSDTGVSCLQFAGNNSQAQNIECLNFNANLQIHFAGAFARCYQCWAHDGTAQTVFAFSNINDQCIYCVAQDITGNVGFSIPEGDCLYCIVDSVLSGASDGFQIGNSDLTTLDHIVVYNVDRDAIRITGTNSRIVITNAVLMTATNGINNASGFTLRAGDLLEDFNFFFDMSGANYSGLTGGSNDVILSADPFTNAAAANFTLNATAGGGAAVKAAGTPTSFMGITGTSFPDGGVFQSAGGGGAGGTISVVFP